ncbi:MAG: dTMP kinase, partial [Ilumatobacteraceae bacterium]
IRRINEWAVDSWWPDLVVLIDTPPELLERRMRGRQLDRFEREDDGFHARVRDGFRSMAAADPSHWVIIDGAASMEEVGSNIRRAVAERVGLG